MPVIADEIYGTMTWKSHPFTPIAALTTTVERGKKASKEESYFLIFYASLLSVVNMLCVCTSSLYACF